jgi:ABC-type amino acid transport substrate-binding protein
MLNEAVQVMITTGEVDKILDKWDPEHDMLKRPTMAWKD